MQIKIFYNNDSVALQNEINTFLATLGPGDVKHILFSQRYDAVTFSVLIGYIT